MAVTGHKGNSLFFCAFRESKIVYQSPNLATNTYRNPASFPLVYIASMLSCRCQLRLKTTVSGRLLKESFKRRSFASQVEIITYVWWSFNSDSSQNVPLVEPIQWMTLLSVRSVLLRFSGLYYISIRFCLLSEILYELIPFFSSICECMEWTIVAARFLRSSDLPTDDKMCME